MILILEILFFTKRNLHLKLKLIKKKNKLVGIIIE